MGRLEALSGALGLKRLIVNFIKVKIIISSETLERLQNIPSFRFILAERV